MLKRVLLSLLGLLVIAQGVVAQNTLPTIVTFTSSPSAITVNAAEAGQTELSLTWVVVYMTDDQQLVLQRRVLHAWVTMTEENETVGAIGTREQPLLHPLDFGPPTYRLLLLDGQGQVIDESILTIPYENPATSPEITLFASSTPAISAEALTNRSARVNVSWQVSNRIPTSNLLFEQILQDGQAVPVELPRDNLWIGSEGSGVVAPIPVQNSIVQLRLRVVDMVNGDVYAEALTEVAVGGEGGIAALPTATPPPTIVAATDEEEILPTPTPRNCVMSPLDVPLTGVPGDGCDTFRQPRTGTETQVVSFNANTLNANPGRSITLSWEITGAQFALLEVYDPNQLQDGAFPEPIQAFYDGLPPSGSQTLTLPSSMTNGARFILWAANLSTEARSPSFLYDRLAYRIIDASPSGTVNTNQAQITAFVALPPVAAPGGEVTLSWNLNGADTALIELFDLGSNTVAGVFEDLPTIGSANVIIPESFTQGARFILWAANRNSDGTFTRLTQSTLELPAE
jgi:hypothetical protein